MTELFGASVGDIALVLGIVFFAIAIFLFVIILRTPILVQMAFRNVYRRPARSALIVIGLMLATAIISSSFTIGDSMTFSIKQNTVNSLRFLDELIRVDDESPVWAGQTVPDGFSQQIFDELAVVLDNESEIDGILPVMGKQVAAINFRSNQFEVSTLLTGIDQSRTSGFGVLRDSTGEPVNLGDLGSDEVFIDQAGARELSVRAGDVLGLALGPGDLYRVTVKDIVDGWYVKRTGTQVVLMVSLQAAQELFHQEGQLTFVLISNRGNELVGETRTDLIVERLADLPIIKEAGLELYPIKREAIELANLVGSLFVTMFTTFGLFSIGVAILLIFLIFSMLAAERKSEMGISRAVGMQRQHLVRMFIAEGAIYGLGSALIGTMIGIGLGFSLVSVVARGFGRITNDAFTVMPHVEVTSLLISFCLGSTVTFLTVVVASIRISRLNIVRAIRDIPEPRLANPGIKMLVYGISLVLVGIVVLGLGFRASQLVLFCLGISLMPIGLSLILRWKGVMERLVLSGTGVVLLVVWLLPPGVQNRIRDDWHQDMSIFFVSGALVVTGAVLLTVNNTGVILGLLTGIFGGIRQLTPILKSAVSYPLKFGFRTGLSLAMFVVVIFSVTVMAVLLEGFDKLLEDHDRLSGGYEVIAYSQTDLNPIQDLSRLIAGDSDLAFVSRSNGVPSVGTLRAIPDASARLSDRPDGVFKDTRINGVDNDFLDSNQFSIKLAIPEYSIDGSTSSAAVWRALKDKPDLAVVNAQLVPTRDNFGFDVRSDNFILDLPGLYRDNKSMDPIQVSVRDLKSGAIFPLTVIGVLDPFASDGFLPGGIYVSSKTLQRRIPFEVTASQFFFNVDANTEGGANKIEAAFFQHGLETIDVQKAMMDQRSFQRSFFNLLIAFMALGLVVGVAALGVISARAVVERRHQIGVMRAIGFSKRMIQMTFLIESSFIGLLGIVIGLVLGLLMSMNIITEIRLNEPNIPFAVPWVKLLAIAVGAYFFTLLTTYLPSRHAAQIAPAEALRYE